MCLQTSDALYYGNKGRDVSLEQTRRDTDFPAQMEIKLSETLVLAGGGGNESPVEKKTISNTFIHFGNVKDQWDETVKLG